MGKARRNEKYNKKKWVDRLEIQQKLKTEKQNKHRHRKLQGKLPEENSKDLFFFWQQKNGAEKEELHGPMFTTPKRLNLCA